jgi:ubiquinone/menaquinone biosynthesis C-methylase UbiE
MFAPVTTALIEEAGIKKGQNVLDVAGGPGEPSLTIAEVTGPTGSVTCTDPIEDMVVTAASEAARRRLENVTFRQCRADSLPFADETYDAVVSRLGVMFFPDPLAALKEMLRVTKSGGSVSLVVWSKSEVNPFSYLVTRAVALYVDSSQPSLNTSDAFCFAEPGLLANLLRKAGANDTRERILHFDITAPISPAEFWAMRSETSGTLRQKLEKLSAADRQTVGHSVLQAVRDFFPNNHMKFPAQMLIVTGKKPEVLP